MAFPPKQKNSKMSDKYSVFLFFQNYDFLVYSDRENQVFFKLVAKQQTTKTNLEKNSEENRFLRLESVNR